MTYQQALDELQQLLSELEQGPTDIDRLGERVQRAKSLIEGCRAKLRDLEEEIIPPPSAD